MAAAPVPDASVAPAACNSSSPLLSAASSLQVEKYLIGCANQYYFAPSCKTLDYSTVVRHEYIYPKHPVRRSSHHYLWGRVLNSLALDKTRQRHRNLPIPPFRVPCIPPSSSSDSNKSLFAGIRLADFGQSPQVYVAGYTLEQLPCFFLTIDF